jgi:hypothetical protein
MAYEFNGTNQFLNTPTTSAVVSGMPITMACWFYPNNNTTRYTLMAMANDWNNWSPPNSGGYLIGAYGNVAGDPVGIGTDNNGAAAVNSTAGFTANQWNHAAGVFTSTTSRTVYLNGGNSATNTVSHNPISPNQGLRLGRFIDVNFPFPLAGQLAEVGIWNAALTAEEIASIAKGMTCDKVRPQNLVFYAPLVRDLIDAKGGRTITNNNGATVANHPRVYA